MKYVCTRDERGKQGREWIDMMRTNAIGTWFIRIVVRIACILLMLVIGAVQAIGTILMAISAVILKSISAVMIFVTVLLQIFGLFTWDKTLIVLLIAGSMFWAPEVMSLVVLGLAVMQAKLRDVLDLY